MHTEPTDKRGISSFHLRLPRNCGVKVREKSRPFAFRHVILYEHSEHHAEYLGMKLYAPKEARQSDFVLCDLGYPWRFFLGLKRGLRRKARLCH